MAAIGALERDPRAKAPFPLSTIIPLADVDPQLVEDLLDTAFEPERRQRTAYRLREGLDWLPGLSFAALDEDEMLAGTIQCWPVALTTPEGRGADDHGRPGGGHARPAGARLWQGAGHRQPDRDRSARAAAAGDDRRSGILRALLRLQQRPHRRLAIPGPFEQHRLLCRTANPAVLPGQGMLGPWRG
jgi:hypothetical protein